MSLENCKRLLAEAEERDDKEQVAFWKARIERKRKHPKYTLPAEPPKKVLSDGKKPKG